MTDINEMILSDDDDVDQPTPGGGQSEVESGKPRTYRKNARRDYLRLARKKKRIA